MSSLNLEHFSRASTAFFEAEDQQDTVARLDLLARAQYHALMALLEVSEAIRDSLGVVETSVDGIQTSVDGIQTSVQDGLHDLHMSVIDLNDRLQERDGI